MLTAHAADSMAVELLIAVNPDEDSRLPYPLRIPLTRGDLVFCASGTWPRTKAQYCYPIPSEDWPDDAVIAERVRLRSVSSRFPQARLDSTGVQAERDVARIVHRGGQGLASSATSLRTSALGAATSAGDNSGVAHTRSPGKVRKLVAAESVSKRRWTTM
jgi:hypothetical protein